MTIDEFQIELGLRTRAEAVAARGAIEQASQDFGVPITAELVAFVGACRPTEQQANEYWRALHDPDAKKAPAITGAAVWRLRVWCARAGIGESPEYLVRLAWIRLIRG